MTRQFTVLHTVRSLRLDGVSKVVIRSVGINAERSSPSTRVKPAARSSPQISASLARSSFACARRTIWRRRR